MIGRLAQTREASAWAALGAFMLAHFVCLCALKLTRSIEGEILWVSHASLLITGLGLLLRSGLLVGVAFISIALLHTLWLLDAAGGILLGRFPLGFTSYLASADPLTIAATSHHVYLLPVTAWWLLTRRGTAQRASAAEAVIVGSLLFGLLTTAGRAFVPSALNVNFAHAFMPDVRVPILIWFNGLPTPAYLVVHLAVCTLILLIPGAKVMRLLTTPRARHDQPQTTRQAPTSAVARGFSLIELIAVMVVLAILAGVALPRYIDYSSDAKEAADEASLGGIKTALQHAYMNHQVEDAPEDEWITSVYDIADVMETGELPKGITISNGRLVDQRGNEYTLVPQTADSSARIEKYTVRRRAS